MLACHNLTKSKKACPLPSDVTVTGVATPVAETRMVLQASRLRRFRASSSSLGRIEVVPVRSVSACTAIEENFIGKVSTVLKEIIIVNFNNQIFK